MLQTPCLGVFVFWNRECQLLLYRLQVVVSDADDDLYSAKYTSKVKLKQSCSCLVIPERIKGSGIGFVIDKLCYVIGQEIDAKKMISKDLATIYC